MLFRSVAALPGIENLQKIGVALLSVTTLAALYGSLVALLRRDWRVLPILAWLLATLVLLYKQQPLFLHHLIALEPPLITLALLGLAKPSAYEVALTRFTVRGNTLARLISGGALLLILAASIGGFWQDMAYYQGANAYARSEERRGGQDCISRVWAGL